MGKSSFYQVLWLTFLNQSPIDSAIFLIILPMVILFSGQLKMKIGVLLWHSIQNAKKAQIIWTSERPLVCWYPSSIPLFLSVIRQDIEVICWNWIGMMNGCFLAWIVIKSWVFCQAKWVLWLKWQMVFIFLVDEDSDYTYSFCCRCTVLEMQEHCSVI